MSDELVDDVFPVQLDSSEVQFEGHVWNVRRDLFEYGAETISREYVDHTGAVAILVLDETDRVLLIKQYRHPIGMREWEIPAGLLDMHGEPPVDGAKRELAEEVDLEAAQWDLLCDFATSPGGSNEVIRVYLARGLTATAHAFERDAEEADIEKRWIDLDEAVTAVLNRTVGNSILSIAVLAAHASRARGWASLGDAYSPWPRHPLLRHV